MFFNLKKFISDVRDKLTCTRTIALFGRSAKNNNYCVAGIDLSNGKYIRPISDIPGLKEAVRCSDYTDINGNEFKDFDIVKIKFKSKKPDNPYQPENLYYDENFRWQKIEALTLKNMIDLYHLDKRNDIFYNSDRSVDPNFVLSQPVRESLLFMEVENIIIKVELYDYPKFYAHFTCNGKKYWRFSVGDINVRNYFRNHPAGEYFYKEHAVVILSLTNPYSYGGNPPKCYKMLAQIF